MKALLYIYLLILPTFAIGQSGKIFGKQEFTDSVKLSKYKNALKQVRAAFIDSNGNITNTPNFTFDKYNSLHVQSVNGGDTCLLQINDSLTDAVDRSEPHVIGSRFERHDNSAYGSVVNFDGRKLGLGKFCVAMISKRSGGRDVEWVFDADSLGGMIAQAGSGFFKFDDNAYTIYAPFQLPAGASNGYVLTSDGAGVGTWQLKTLAGHFSDTISSDNKVTIALPFDVGTDSYSISDIQTSTSSAKGYNVWIRSKSSSEFSLEWSTNVTGTIEFDWTINLR